MINLKFEHNAERSERISESVREFLRLVKTLEESIDAPIVVFQDGKSKAYYIKCNILATDASRLCDIKARQDVSSDETYKANRDLWLTHKTYKKMAEDARDGREFNDIIVEYTTAYTSTRPLKVWGGQHRIQAISDSSSVTSRFHGFRVYFGLSKEQRTELAIISNINMAVSDDTFDRMLEENEFGDMLRLWCQRVGLLPEKENFPDVGSKSAYITVRLARTFIVNFYNGRLIGKDIESVDLEERYYDPYFAESGTTVDPEYEKIVHEINDLTDGSLVDAGLAFAKLNRVQRKAVKESRKVRSLKGFTSKAQLPSVISAWSFVAGLLQSHPCRLANHYAIPKTNSKIPDPLNAQEMSEFRITEDPRTYRGLGTRNDLRERRRLAQLFVSRSREGGAITKTLMRKAVKRVVALVAYEESR